MWCLARTTLGVISSLRYAGCCWANMSSVNQVLFSLLSLTHFISFYVLLHRLGFLVWCWWVWCDKVSLPHFSFFVGTCSGFLPLSWITVSVREISKLQRFGSPRWLGFLFFFFFYFNQSRINVRFFFRYFFCTNWHMNFTLMINIF